MERLITPVSHLLTTIKRPELDYPKMKQKLGEILTKNTQLIDTLKLPVKKLAVSMEQTAKQIAVSVMSWMKYWKICSSPNRLF